MEIERIIGRLLTQHDCVIIPGFGGFIANPKGAVIHPGRHTFTPPYKAILFNSSLTANDGLLANALAFEKGIAYLAAVAEIEKFVSKAKADLNKRERVTFADLGYLQADFEGNINFTQDLSVNHLFDSFGLGDFQSLPIEGNATERRFQPKVERVVVHPAKANRKRVSPRKVLAAASVTLLFAIASALVGIGVKDTQNMAHLFAFMHTDTAPAKKQEAAKPARPQAEVKAEMPKVKAPAAQVTEATEEIATEPAPATPTKIKTPVIEKAHIHVIAAEYADMAKAEKRAKQLKNQGYDTFIVEDGAYKVGIASFYKQENAHQFIDLLAAPLKSEVTIYTEQLDIPIYR